MPTKEETLVGVAPLFILHSCRFSGWVENLIVVIIHAADQIGKHAGQ